jgi:urease accessory protein
MHSRFVWVAAVILIWAGIPSRASAHLVNSGLGPFYDGIAHVFVTPEDVLLIVAVALLAGLGGPRVGRTVMFALPAAWLTGAVVGRITELSTGLPALSAALLIILGILVAADRRLPFALVAAFALLCGLIHGCFNGVALAAMSAGGVALVGIVWAVFVLVALIAGQVASLRAAWARTAVRAAGSWIGAIGFLLLGWSAR